MDAVDEVDVVVRRSSADVEEGKSTDDRGHARERFDRAERIAERAVAPISCRAPRTSTSSGTSRTTCDFAGAGVVATPCVVGGGWPVARGVLGTCSLWNSTRARMRAAIGVLPRRAGRNRHASTLWRAW